MQVAQSAVVVPMQDMTAQLLHILTQHQAADPEHKVGTSMLPVSVMHPCSAADTATPCDVKTRK